MSEGKQEEDFCLQDTFNKSQVITRLDKEIIDMMTDEEACDVAYSIISFKNAHLVAHKLAFSDPVVAKALLNELKYYEKQGRI